MIIKDWLDAHPDKSDIISLAIDFAEWKIKAKQEQMEALKERVNSYTVDTEARLEWNKIVSRSTFQWFQIFIEQYKHEL